MDAQHSVETLKREALSGLPPIDNHLPLSKYLKPARVLELQAGSYLAQQMHAEAFVLYYRLGKLLVALRAHPQWSSISASDNEWQRTAANAALDTLEELRPMFASVSLNSVQRVGRKPSPPSPSILATATTTASSSQPTATYNDYPAGGPTRAEQPLPTTIATMGHARAVMSPATSPVTQNQRTAAAAGAPAYPALPADRSFFAMTDDNSPVVAQLQPTANPRHSVVLSSVMLPHIIIDRFTALAAPNTNLGTHGIETCGVLAGRPLRDGSFQVAHLIIPEQIGGPDQCEMTAEERLLGYCLAEGLLTLGWIHTHPSQDCFMSSMDLHTHYDNMIVCNTITVSLPQYRTESHTNPHPARCTMCVGYQSSLPEAVAVVIAPRDKRVGWSAFRLTSSSDGRGGLTLIGNCKLRGFHPHDDSMYIYETAEHCVWNSSANLVVVDQR